jgi:hypothetical protein
MLSLLLTTQRRQSALGADTALERCVEQARIARPAERFGGAGAVDCADWRQAAKPPRKRLVRSKLERGGHQSIPQPRNDEIDE